MRWFDQACAGTTYYDMKVDKLQMVSCTQVTRQVLSRAIAGTMCHDSDVRIFNVHEQKAANEVSDNLVATGSCSPPQHAPG